MLMIKRNDIVDFIPKSTTQTLEFVDPHILPLLCYKMVTNLLPSPLALEMVIQSFGTRVQMGLLET